MDGPLGRFAGSFAATIDEKGRVAIPAKLREKLDEEGSLMMTAHVVSTPDAMMRCLELWPIEAWNKMIDNLQQQSGAFSQIRELFELNYIGNAQLCPKDRQGRIPVPLKLRQLARINQDVTFVGSGPKIRIFDAATHAQAFDSYEATLRSNPDILRGLGI